MQSSNLDNIGIKPSLFIDKVGEFNFCKNKRIVLKVKTFKTESILSQPLCVYFKHFTVLVVLLKQLEGFVINKIANFLIGIELHTVEISI